MYARVTTYHCDPALLDEMKSKFEEIKGQIKSLAGVVDIYSAWRSDGHGVGMAIYESQEAAEAASEQVQAMWEDFWASFLTAAPSIEVYDNVVDLTGKLMQEQRTES